MKNIEVAIVGFAVVVSMLALIFAVKDLSYELSRARSVCEGMAVANGKTAADAKAVCRG